MSPPKKNEQGLASNDFTEVGDDDGELLTKSFAARRELYFDEKQSHEEVKLTKLGVSETSTPSFSSSSCLVVALGA